MFHSYGMVWVTKIPWPVFGDFSTEWAQGLEFDAATGCGWGNPGGMGEGCGWDSGAAKGFWLGRPLNLNWFLVPAASWGVSATPLMLGSDLELFAGFRLAHPWSWGLIWVEHGTLHFRSCSQFSLKTCSTPVWLCLLSLFQLFAFVIHQFLKWSFSKETHTVKRRVFWSIMFKPRNPGETCGASKSSWKIFSWKIPV